MDKPPSIEQTIVLPNTRGMGIYPGTGIKALSAPFERLKMAL